jgi:preprotein translocase subunit SecG
MGAASTFSSGQGKSVFLGGQPENLLKQLSLIRVILFLIIALQYSEQMNNFYVI